MGTPKYPRVREDDDAGDLKYRRAPPDKHEIEMRTYSASKRVRESSYSSRRHASRLGKPQIAISCWSSKHKRLCQSSQDLPKHHESKDATIGSRTRVPDPITQEQEDGRPDDRLLGSAVERPYRDSATPSATCITG